VQFAETDKVSGLYFDLGSGQLVFCGQTVGWIKMKLGTEVGLGPGHIVLDVDPALPSPPQSGTAPNFLPMSIVAKRLDG